MNVTCPLCVNVTCHYDVNVTCPLCHVSTMCPMHPHSGAMCPVVLCIRCPLCTHTVNRYIHLQTIYIQLDLHIAYIHLHSYNQTYTLYTSGQSKWRSLPKGSKWPGQDSNPRTLVAGKPKSRCSNHWTITSPNSGKFRSFYILQNFLV